MTQRLIIKIEPMRFETKEAGEATLTGIASDHGMVLLYGTLWGMSVIWRISGRVHDGHDDRGDLIFRPNDGFDQIRDFVRSVFPSARS